jgi:hypothetical protein
MNINIMPFITFIYRIGRNNKVFYGKYVCDYISDDHEGLNNEIKDVVNCGITEYRKQMGLIKINKKISIGILSLFTHDYIPTYSSDAEINCFDFYHKNHTLKNDETYVNGKLIK